MAKKGSLLETFNVALSKNVNKNSMNNFKSTTTTDRVSILNVQEMPSNYVHSTYFSAVLNNTLRQKR